MSGIRKTARLISVKAKCGHLVNVMLPPGEMGYVGQTRVELARTSVCNKCLKESK